MKIKHEVTTNTGFTIDADDDASIIKHDNYYEIIYDNYILYCESIQ